MKDELLRYYQQELDYLKNKGADFAKRYPKIAGLLSPNHTEIADPAVDRLIEAVAFMNARVHHRLDDDFSELTEGLFDVLQLAYRQPFPSMTVAQFQPQADLAEAFRVPKGTVLEHISEQHEPLRLSACYETTLLPIAVESAALVPHANNARP